MAYKTAAKLDQSRLRRPIRDYLQTGFESLSAIEQHMRLKEAVKEVAADIAIETDKWRRKALCIEKERLSKEIQRTRPLPKRLPATTAHYFIQSAKRMLTKGMYNMIMSDALFSMGTIESAKVDEIQVVEENDHP